MSTETQIASGCSACLVAAIEHRDEAAVRRMLSDQTVQYVDTVWLPLALNSKFRFIKHEPWSLTFVSCSVAESSQVCDNICPHPSAIESLETGQEIKSCAISVLLMAMLFSTPDFNALQILIESGRFDLREPLIFHQFDLYRKWVLIAVNALGMASYTNRHC